MQPDAVRNNWQEVWHRKGSEAQGCDLESLMRADGFDAGTGCISVDDWWRTSRRISEALALGPGRSVLEVGCGAGAMLHTMQESGARLSGIDYSPTLIERARAALPGVDLRSGEAQSLPYENESFDGAFSHGVFFYFPGFEYARLALEELVRVVRPGGAIFILDVPDAATMEACEAYRREVVYGGADYPTAQDGPYRHLYYPREFFSEFAAERGMRAVTSSQDLESYPMSPYRFNALLTKP